MIRAAAILVFGKVYTGKRHSDAFRAARFCGLDRLDLQKATQGFVTDDGRFLDRKVAAGHALACGQVKTLKDPNCLYSEDLY